MVSFDRIADIPYPQGMDWLEFNRLMLPHGASLIHASVVEHRGSAVLFLGESGTGKSTQSCLWLEHIPSTSLLNDDCPAIRLPYVYGTPWSGKTPCYRQEHFPIRALVRLSQSPENHICRLSTLEAFAALQPSFAPELFAEEQTADLVVDLISRIIQSVPVYHLACLPNREAAEITYQELYGHSE